MFGITVMLCMLFVSYLELTKNWSLQLTVSLQDSILVIFFCYYGYVCYGKGKKSTDGILSVKLGP